MKKQNGMLTVQAAGRLGGIAAAKKLGAKGRSDRARRAVAAREKKRKGQK